MATYLADRVIVFEGQPAITATATPYDTESFLHFAHRVDFCHRPQSLLSGMNRFLASLEITFRRDPTNFRPRVNKLHSIKDREQKGMCLWSKLYYSLLIRTSAAGNYFFLED